MKYLLMFWDGMLLCLGRDIFLSCFEHSKDKVLKKTGSKLPLLRVLSWLKSTMLERTPN